MFLQWLYLGRVELDDEAPEDRIAAAIELARLADMLGSSGLEAQMAELIKAAIIDDSEIPNPDSGEQTSTTEHVTPQHISAARNLPKGHAVRLMFAEAAVEGFLHSDRFKFLNELQENPDFASDLLQELGSALKTASGGHYATYLDPFSGRKLDFHLDQDD